MLVPVLISRSLVWCLVSPEHQLYPDCTWREGVVEARSIANASQSTQEWHQCLSQYLVGGLWMSDGRGTQLVHPLHLCASKDERYRAAMYRCQLVDLPRRMAYQQPPFSSLINQIYRDSASEGAPCRRHKQQRAVTSPKNSASYNIHGALN